MNQLPPASTWERYPEIAIAVLFIVAILAIFGFIWREYRKWGREQEVIRQQQQQCRDDEAERQRQWQAEQNHLREEEQGRRDAAWRQFFEQLQVRQETANAATNTVLAEISKQVNALTLEIRSHDVWVHEAIRPEEKGRGGKSRPPG